MPGANRSIFQFPAGGRGFTVVEMLIGLAAIGIVVLVAVPGSAMMLEKHRMKSASDSLIIGLELARTEASMRSSTVIMCPSSNGSTCRKDGNWQHGWIVFTDGDGNGEADDIELIQSFRAPSPRILIQASGAVELKAPFTATGLVRDSHKHSGSFQICYKDSIAPVTVVTVDADGWVQQVPSQEKSCAAS